MTPWTIAHQAPLSMEILQARILEWVAMPSSEGSSEPRGWTQFSHIAGGFFTIWATSEAHDTYIKYKKKSRDNAVVWFYLYVNSDCWYCLGLDTDKVSLSKHGGIMLGGRSFLLNRVKHVLLKIILKRKCLDFSCFKLVFSEFKALIWVTLKWEIHDKTWQAFLLLRKFI